MADPRVSVVMAVHNSLPHLQAAVDSILSQTLVDFELIVVEDASTDGSAEVLAAFQDSRLRILPNEENLGLTRSLNRGLEAARGAFIARMDADDLSLPRRLSEQVGYLEAHPAVNILGAAAETIGARQETWRFPAEDAEIRATLLFHSALIHSSTMWRRSSFERHDLRYDPEIAQAQDYDLWVRAAEDLRFANLERVLLRYRLHAAQIGAQQGGRQQAVARQVRQRQLAALGLEPSDEEFALHNRISLRDFPRDFEGLQQMEAWLLKLRRANQGNHRYRAAALDRVLEAFWWSACSGAVHLGRPAWQLYRHSPLAVAGRSWTQRARFLVKSNLAGWR